MSSSSSSPSSSTWPLFEDPPEDIMPTEQDWLNNLSLSECSSDLPDLNIEMERNKTYKDSKENYIEFAKDINQSYTRDFLSSHASIDCPQQSDHYVIENNMGEDRHKGRSQSVERTDADFASMDLRQILQNGSQPPSAHNIDNNRHRSEEMTDERHAQSIRSTKRSTTDAISCATPEKMRRRQEFIEIRNSGPFLPVLPISKESLVSDNLNLHRITMEEISDRDSHGQRYSFLPATRRLSTSPLDVENKSLQMFPQTCFNDAFTQTSALTLSDNGSPQATAIDVSPETARRSIGRASSVAKVSHQVTLVVVSPEITPRQSFAPSSSVGDVSREANVIRDSPLTSMHLTPTSGRKDTSHQRNYVDVSIQISRRSSTPVTSSEFASLQTNVIDAVPRPSELSVTPTSSDASRKSSISAYISEESTRSLVPGSSIADASSQPNVVDKSIQTSRELLIPSSDFRDSNGQSIQSSDDGALSQIGNFVDASTQTSFSDDDDLDFNTFWRNFIVGVPVVYDY